jgi:hypothetical protein
MLSFFLSFFLLSWQVHGPEESMTGICKAAIAYVKSFDDGNGRA